MNLPDIILLQQTGKDKELPPFTCHTSTKTVNARKDWMNEKSTFSCWTLLKTHRDSTILHSRTAKKLTDNVYKKNFRIFKCSRRNYCDFQWIFGADTKVRTMVENYSLGRHSETHAKLVIKLFEATSWFCWTREGAILTSGFAVVNGCIACICS